MSHIAPNRVRSDRHQDGKANPVPPHPLPNPSQVSRMSPPVHVVYCLTSSGGDLYEAMTRVSLATLRHTNPSARVTVACDQQTHQALQASGSKLSQEADAVCGFPTSDGPPTYRNRFVKTQLGGLIDGPFLFLDSDTVVRKPLTPLHDLHCDIAAAPNHSRDTLGEQIWSEDQANLDAMCWLVREPYLNGGVLWYGGTLNSRRFAEVWHQNWIASVEATGIYRDQPSFNYSLFVANNLCLHTLDHKWNAQIRMASCGVESAVIWHVYSSVGLEPRNHFSRCCEYALNHPRSRIHARALRLLVKSNSLDDRIESESPMSIRFGSLLKCIFSAGS